MSVNSIEKIKAIPGSCLYKYKGRRFCSATDAKWSMLFDSLGIDYEYTPREVAAFYLPQSHQFLHTGNTSDDAIRRSIRFLLESGIPVSVGYDDMSFRACSRDFGDEHTFHLEEDKSGSMLVRCAECGGYFFLGVTGYYKCPCCGDYDGDHDFEVILDGDWPSPDPRYSGTGRTEA